MAVIDNILFFIFFIIVCTDTYTNGEIAATPVLIQQLDIHTDHRLQPRANNDDDKVDIQLLYECFCLDCRNFDTSQFQQVVLKLNEYLNIRTYPYGNAETVEHNGKYKFKCQHGPGECYGNKLHACALNIINNHTEALLYNSCMMDYSQSDQGSDDQAAQKCGASMNIDSEPIKACAKGEQGMKLLKYYGDESKKINYQYVPYILINGKENDGNNFMRDVCAAYHNPPPPCASVL